MGSPTKTMLRIVTSHRGVLTRAVKPEDAEWYFEEVKLKGYFANSFEWISPNAILELRIVKEEY